MGRKDRINFTLQIFIFLSNDYLVSTIGEFYVNKDDEKMEEIGCDRFYETYVFKVKNNELRECGCPTILDHTEIDSDGYQTALEAQEGHIKMCLKWENKE